MKKIVNLPLKGSIAFLLNDNDINIFGHRISFNGKRFTICDNCTAAINKGSYIYVPVMNRVLCQRCFDDWQRNGKWFAEDNNYQNRYALADANKLGYKSLDDIPTIEYNNVDTDSDDKYANLSNAELKEIYDDIVADDEISRQKEL
jgi:hypothetical protein